MQQQFERSANIVFFKIQNIRNHKKKYLQMSQYTVQYSVHTLLIDLGNSFNQIGFWQYHQQKDSLPHLLLLHYHPWYYAPAVQVVLGPQQ